MARKVSTITIIDGKRYRLTPIDERHEEQAANWTKTNMHMIATRVNNENYNAIKAICMKEKRTIYELLQALVTEWLATETLKQFGKL